MIRTSGQLTMVALAALAGGLAYPQAAFSQDTSEGADSGFSFDDLADLEDLEDLLPPGVFPPSITTPSGGTEPSETTPGSEGDSFFGDLFSNGGDGDGGGGGGGGGGGSGLNTPQNMVRPAALAARRPGLWVQRALVSPEITATESEDDVRIINQFMWSLLDMVLLKIEESVDWMLNGGPLQLINTGERRNPIIRTLIRRWLLGTGQDLLTDIDGDGVSNNTDNCLVVANPGQENADADSEGDACDVDDDNDGILDGADNCPNNANFDQDDNDGDGDGDVCDEDDDDDGILDDGDNSGTDHDNPCTGGETADCDDNCPFVANADQIDTDGDLIGDACD